MCRICPENGKLLSDYEVKQKPDDTAKGIDTALQFTLNLIKDPNSIGLAKQKDKKWQAKKRLLPVK